MFWVFIDLTSVMRIATVPRLGALTMFPLATSTKDLDDEMSQIKSFA